MDKTKERKKVRLYGWSLDGETWGGERRFWFLGVGALDDIILVVVGRRELNENAVYR